MINLENILNTPVIHQPWDHKQIDNVLSTDFLEILTAEVIRVKDTVNLKTRDSVWLHETGISPAVLDTILALNRDFLKIAPDLLSQFTPTNVSKIGYFGIPRFNFTQNGYTDHIHHDGETSEKSLFMTIYLYPDISTGTRFYHNDSQVKIADWVPNRAFCFAPITDVTWHNFKTETADRITLSFCYERIEDMKNINRMDADKVAWFYENFDRLV